MLVSQYYEATIFQMLLRVSYDCLNKKLSGTNTYEKVVALT